MQSSVIYTTIFGNYDEIRNQTLPNGWDWKCFSEENSLSLYTDNTRNAKRFKVLPHRYLQNYEYSIFIDGNMYVVGNMNELVETYLTDCNVAFFSHNKNKLDARNCIYDEANLIINAGNTWMEKTPERGMLNYKDNPYIIKEQIDRWK